MDNHCLVSALDVAAMLEQGEVQVRILPPCLGVTLVKPSNRKQRLAPYKAICRDELRVLQAAGVPFKVGELLRERHDDTPAQRIDISVHGLKSTLQPHWIRQRIIISKC